MLFTSTRLQYRRVVKGTSGGIGGETPNQAMMI